MYIELQLPALLRKQICVSTTKFDAAIEAQREEIEVKE
jgi:hypothetical protein